MECRRSMMVWLGFMCVMLTALICSSQARPPRTFQAGGRDGWSLLPDDGLNRWAAKRRFRVNDTIGLLSDLLLLIYLFLFFLGIVRKRLHTRIILRRIIAEGIGYNIINLNMLLDQIYHTIIVVR